MPGAKADNAPRSRVAVTSLVACAARDPSSAERASHGWSADAVQAKDTEPELNSSYCLPGSSGTEPSTKVTSHGESGATLKSLGSEEEPPPPAPQLERAHAAHARRKRSNPGRERGLERTSGRIEWVIECAGIGGWSIGFRTRCASLGRGGSGEDRGRDGEQAPAG